MQGTACGVWHRHMLLTTSLPEAHCIFATAGDGTPRQPPFVEVHSLPLLHTTPDAAHCEPVQDVVDAIMTFSSLS